VINIIKSDQRHHQNFGWLDARWHFSFGDYHDPANLSWGPLRVFNDDVIAGGGRFEPHPHRDMEIITYVIDGELAHEDSLGNGDVIRPGDVQVMSAGKGIVHSEFNNSKDKPVRLNQIWIMPRTKGQAPRWEQKAFSPDGRKNALLPVVTENGAGGTLRIDQDATIYVSSLAEGRELKHELKPGRRAYLFVTSGAASLNSQRLAAGDQARIERESELSIRAATDSELILIDLP
jgi:redox-sensitive bicupin YhaK (pirin superfamily)